MRSLIFILLLYPITSWADDPQEVIGVTEDIRFGPVCLEPENVCSEIIEIRKKETRWVVERSSLGALSSMLSPENMGEFDEAWSKWDDAAQKLVIRPPEAFRTPRLLTPPMSIPKMVARPLAWGANYASYLSQDSHSVLVSPFVSKNDTVFKGSWQYRQGDWSKGLVYLEHDHREKGVRWGVGDRAVVSRDPVGLGVVVEGVSFEKAHDLTPYSPFRSRPSWQGVLLEAGVLDIYSNGSLVSTTPVKPGFYEWYNLGLNGSGHLKGVLKTNTGQQEVFSERRFGGTNLAEGVADFAFYAGKTPSRQMLLSGYYAKGLTEWLTVGGQHAQVPHKHQTSVSLSLQPNLPVSGNVQVAQDHAQRQAYAWSLAGGYQSISASYGQRYIDRGFWDLGDEQNLGLEEIAQERTSSLNLAGGWGSLAFSHQIRKNIDWERSELSSATYSRSFNTWQMFATAQKSSGFPVNVFVGVTVPLGVRSTLHTQYRHTDENVFGLLYQRRAQNDGLGASYHVQAQSNGTGNLSYRHGYQAGVLYTDVDVDDRVHPTLGWSGSIMGYQGGRWHVSRPSESFLVVQSDAQGVDVLKNNQKVGVVPASGSLVLSDIPSYSGMKISLEQKQVSIDVAQKNLETTIQTPRLGVGLVTFDTSPPKEVQGVLHVNGQPAKFGMLVFQDGQEVFVGERGDIEFVWEEEMNMMADFYTDTGEKWSCSLTLSEDRRHVDKNECLKFNENKTENLEKP